MSPAATLKIAGSQLTAQFAILPTMLNTLYLPEIREMLAEGDEAGLREFCTALHPARTAEFMEGLTPDEAWRVLQHADEDERVAIFGYLDQDKQVEIVESQPRDEIAALIAEKAPDDRVDLLKEVEDAVVDELLPLVPAEERRDIIRLTAYPEGTAGSVMTTEVAKASETLTVGETLEELQHQANELETIYYLYVVDDEDHLRGIVSARQLLSSIGHPQTSLADLMEADVVTVQAIDDQEDVAQKMARYDFAAIPVVDAEHRLLGIITYDDVFDVVREEATEDAHRIAAVEPLRESYLTMPLLTLSWNRGMWLVILFFGAFLTAVALRHYDAHLEHWPWLVLFIPLVISSGGNSGSQSATLVITALTLGDVSLADWRRVLLREILMGLTLGGFLGGCSLAVAWLLTDEINSFTTALIVPMTLLLVVISGTLLGSLLPLVFKRLGLDPALMSNPFVAGIVDILGIVIYVNVAMALLPSATP